MDGQGHFTLCLLLWIILCCGKCNNTQQMMMHHHETVLAQALNDLCMLIWLQTKVFCQTSNYFTTSIRYILTTVQCICRHQTLHYVYSMSRIGAFLGRPGCQQLIFSLIHELQIEGSNPTKVDFFKISLLQKVFQEDQGVNHQVFP